MGLDCNEIGVEQYKSGLARLVRSYRAIPAGATVRLAKKTSNLFRRRERNPHPGLDVSGLDGVISVDVENRTADVAGMCTYERLVATTLTYGLLPEVVPQLKTITLGGAVTGMGIESTSFRNGLPHESVIEMDILTGDGEVVTAAPTGDHADLFAGFPNSYGTLGYSTRLRISLEPALPYVALRHVRFNDLSELTTAMAEIINTRQWDGERVDYLDGVVFTDDEAYLCLGAQSASATSPGTTEATDNSTTSSVSNYRGEHIYYRSIQHESAQSPKRDVLTIADYIWRWDTDWFWCSRAFGAQNHSIRRWWPKRLLRSSFYWKLIALDHRFDIANKLNAREGKPPQERVVQDIEVPLERTAEFLHWFLETVPIEPLWLCPLRLREPTPASADPSRPWPLYPIEPRRTYVNVGFWSAVPITPGNPTGHTNRLIERKVAELDGHKSLYSESFYGRDEFETLYGGAVFTQLKSRYDPKSRLLDLYEKTVRAQ